MSINSLSHRGDTIVEVLISVALVGIVLGTCYIGSNRAYQQIEVSQQHQIAITIAQTQLELLNTSDLSSLTFPGCFYQPALNAAYKYANVSKNECNKFESSLSLYPEDFSVIINPPNGSGALGTYQINVKWQSIVGSNVDVSLYYQTQGQ